MVAATNPTKHWCAPGDGLWLLERGRNRPAATWWMGAGFTGKTGQRGDHRPRAFKTGHRSDHRLRRRETVPGRRRRPGLPKTGQGGYHRLWRGVGLCRTFGDRAETRTQSLGQRLCALPRLNRSRPRQGPPTLSAELADRTIYVIDVAEGDKIPRKGGPGITRSDLLVINKIDLAPYVGASLEVMERDSRK